MSKKAFSIISLGCFRNTYDSEFAANRFLDQGYIFKEPGQRVDCLIINTCGFIKQAKEESIEVIRQAVELKKQKKIKYLIVFGCLVQRYRKELEKFFPLVDEWDGVREFSANFKKYINLVPAHIGFLKICEGCVNKCSYCAIPLIKGKLRSKPFDKIIKEAKFLARNGVKELNIIGQDITSYGRDLGSSVSLAELIKGILKEAKSIKWIRLVYTHPKHISDDLLELIAKEERICKYIDLPIQHINDRILKLMNRGITKRQIVSLIKKIREKIPGCFIRTSVIAGFPTESELEFKELKDFLKEAEFERLGVFVYSREEGTVAGGFKGQIHYRVKQRRRGEIMLAQKDIVEKINNRFIGRPIDVLVDEQNHGVFSGRTQFDAYDVDGVVYLNKKNLKTGIFYKTEIIDSLDYDLIGV